MHCMIAASREMSDEPERISRLNTPPISVMGLNVMEQINEDEWIIGSFSGLYME